MASTDKVISRKDGNVGYVIFNNPERRNAMSLEMWEATTRLMSEYAKDNSIRVVVLSGAGDKAFVAGADISKFGDERSSEEGVKKYNDAVEAAYASVHEFPKPTIAMIRGFCVGGGMGIASCCDLRIASEDARFAVPAAKLGLGYGYPGVKRLMDIVGPSFTKEIFYTARLFDVMEAVEMGLVNRVVENSELEFYVKDYAATIAANAPLTVDSIKFIVGEACKDESQRDMKHCDDVVQACFKSEDYKEGRAAFMEKRKPVFKGR
ncbi:MAG: enoyl-CoA hydratase/isomerase family protein [Afipia sp.]|nr:enoyl-CoA hydratase/isomerase family protein [Afipia sp.]